VWQVLIEQLRFLVVADAPDLPDTDRQRAMAASMGCGDELGIVASVTGMPSVLTSAFLTNRHQY